MAVMSLLTVRWVHKRFTQNEIHKTLSYAEWGKMKFTKHCPTQNGKNEIHKTLSYAEWEK